MSRRAVSCAGDVYTAELVSQMKAILRGRPLLSPEFCDSPYEDLLTNHAVRLLGQINRAYQYLKLSKVALPFDGYRDLRAYGGHELLVAAAETGPTDWPVDITAEQWSSVPLKEEYKQAAMNDAMRTLECGITLMQMYADLASVCPPPRAELLVQQLIGLVKRREQIEVADHFWREYREREQVRLQVISEHQGESRRGTGEPTKQLVLRHEMELAPKYRRADGSLKVQALVEKISEITGMDETTVRRKRKELRAEGKLS